MPGQTLAEVRSLLAAAGISPLHRFGQNFLIDLNLMRKVVEAAELSGSDVILEVGPGTGSLTEFLLASGARVIAVEIDRGFQKILTARFAAEPRFRLIAGDALAGKNELNPAISEALDEWFGNTEGWVGLRSTRPTEQGGTAHPIGPAVSLEGTLPDGRGSAQCKLVANLPYQIATPLVLELLAREPRIELLVVTIQKEVGEKLMAAVGTPDYGPLAIVVQTVATVERVGVLPPTAFWPAPKVESVLMRIRRRPEEQASPAGSRCHTITAAEVPAFSAFVRDSFQQRRKTIRNAAKRWGQFANPQGGVDASPVTHHSRGGLRSEPTDQLRGEFSFDAILAACGVSPTQRPEELSIETWQRLFRCLRDGPTLGT